MEDPILIGIDPGRKDVITAAIMDKAPRETLFTISGRCYMEMSGARYRVRKERSFFRDCQEWRDQMPSIDDRVHTLSHLYGPESQLSSLITTANTTKAKRLRFQKYICKLKTDATICRNLLRKSGYFADSRSMFAIGGSTK